MGAKVSKPSGHYRKQPEAVDSGDDSSSDDHQATSFRELLKQECLKEVKHKKNKKEVLTLEDWLLSSPSWRLEFNDGGELCVLKHMSERMRPPSPITRQAIYPREGQSFSLESLVLLDREADEYYFSISSMDIFSCSRNQSQKLKKTVTFKSPDEADIILFYSPKDQLEIVDQERMRPPSPITRQAIYSTEKQSVSLESLVLLDREADEHYFSISSMDVFSCSRNQGQKLKKTVTFKSPDEADIILFYSPKDQLEIIDQVYFL